MDFRREPIADLAAQVRAGTRTARDLVAHALERIETLNPKLNAFVAVDADGALEAATAHRRRGDSRRGPGPVGRHPHRREGPR